MTDTSVTLITATYQQQTAAKPYVPAPTYGRPTLGATGVRNKLFRTDCRISGQILVCELPIRVALQPLYSIIRVFTFSNGIHLFRSPYTSRFLTHSATRFTHNATRFQRPVRSSSPLCVGVTFTVQRDFPFVRRCYIHSVSVSFHRMVSEMLKMIGEYVQQLQGMSFVHRFPSGVDCIVMTVVRTDYFSRTCSATRHSPSAFYRT